MESRIAKNRRHVKATAEKVLGLVLIFLIRKVKKCAEKNSCGLVWSIYMR